MGPPAGLARRMDSRQIINLLGLSCGALPFLTEYSSTDIHLRSLLSSAFKAWKELCDHACSSWATWWAVGFNATSLG